MDIRGKRLVVIGGAGLIGSHTVDALTREDVGEIVVFDNFVRGTAENLAGALRDDRVSVFEIGGDITQPDILNAALKGADGVFHFAALWLLQCHEFPQSAFEVNIRGTFNVLEACVAQGVQRLVLSSSASVYGDAVEEPMTEEHPFNNRNFYGATKIAGEAMARAYNERYGLDYVGLRYMNVYGARQDYRGAYIAVIMKMLDAIDRGEPVTLYGDGSQAYDFVYVTDCAAANVCAMRADATDRFYNVGTGTRTSLRELAEMVLSITGSDVGIRYEPQGLTFVKNRIGDPTAATRDLGYTASVDLEDGLRELIAWRRGHMDQVAARRARAAGEQSRVADLEEPVVAEAGAE
jgi:UDP-glucose 4-epimerase